MRLDIFLVIHHHYTRNKAQQLIDIGLISVNGVKRLKASYTVEIEDSITVWEDKRIHWVSRSAAKLDGFLEDTPDISLLWKNCLDVGSSTWWFTQVLLERWVRHVDAVDVGTDQLHSLLKDDLRVMSYEQTDIRDFARRFPRSSNYDVIVCDASFISLQDIFASILGLAWCHTDMILLWKPQFEVGREHLRKTGVPKSEKVIFERQKVWENCIQNNTCIILQKEKSTLTGEAGNQEWVYHICKSENYK